VEEADAGAGEDQQAANVEGRRLGAFRSFVELGVLDEGLSEKQQEKGAAEADDGLQQQ
jgi:hypothetical protein